MSSRKSDDHEQKSECDKVTKRPKILDELDLPDDPLTSRTYLRAMYPHEEGMYYMTKTWRLPLEWSPDIELFPEWNESFSFLKALVTKSAKVEDMRKLSPCLVQLEKMGVGAEAVLEFHTPGIYTDEDDCELVFDQFMNLVCGKAVKNATGYIISIIVPTSC
jgi:hypothetical protein